MPRVINLTVGNGQRASSLIDRAELPYKVPSQEAYYKVAGSKILAPHIMQHARKSIDNKNAFTDATEYVERVWRPTGAKEGTTDHGVYGGAYRNRPERRAPLTGSGTVGTVGGWQWQDKVTELQSLIDSYWLNAFVDILGSDTFPHALEWASVAVSLGWSDRLIFMPDGSTSIARNGATNLKNYSVQAFSHATGGAAWKKHTDGRYLVVFYGPEFVLGDPVSFTVDQVVNYMVDYCTQMDAAGYPIALGGVFSRAWRDSNQKTAIVLTDPRLAQWSVFLGRWGGRSPQEIAGVSNDAYNAAVYSRTPPPNGYGFPYIDTGAVEDTRPNQGKYYEAVGWKLLVDFYARARATQPEGIQFATANDYPEGTALFPNEFWGRSHLDVCTYYNLWQITGTPPEITKDALYMAYRTMNIPGLGTQPTLSHDAATVLAADGITQTKQYTKKMVNGGGSPGVNNIDVLYFATASGEIRATIGGVAETPVAITAGVNRVQFPMRSGTITIGIYRNNTLVPGSQVTSLSGQDINLTNAEVQDFVYRRVSSLRQAA